jgi:hypothetical protein
MLKRFDKPGMIKLVRKSPTEGKAVVKSRSNLGWTGAFLALRLVKYRFIVNYDGYEM